MTETAPPIPRPAATVILVRQDDGEPQVYLLKRSARSVYMAGFYVFPGGALDPEDGGPFWQPHLDCSPETLAQRFGEDLPLAELIALGVTAIRETFEEAGTLLARGRSGRGDQLQVIRAQRLGGHLSPGWLKQLVNEGNWALQLSALHPWSHWITPHGMSRRFDARYFLADMPPGQDCRPDGGETTDGVWITPAEALAANLAGDIPLSPPIVVTLQQMLPFRSADALKQQALSHGWGPALRPRLISLDDGAVILEPWDPWYQDKDVCLDRGALKEAILPPGEPFSRLFYHQGLWRPVGHT